jgi:hypothetical protein
VYSSALHLLFFGSGACGLVYELVWTRWFGYTLLSAWGEAVPLLLMGPWARIGGFGPRAFLNAATVFVLLFPVSAFGYALPALVPALPVRDA